MVSADQARHNMRVGGGPVGTGRARSASHRLPEPPPLMMPVCEQTRIERVPLADPDPAPGVVGGEGEQDYAVVLHTVSPAVAAGRDPVEHAPLSAPDTSSGHEALTVDAGELDADLDDDTGVVRSVN